MKRLCRQCCDDIGYHYICPDPDIHRCHNCGVQSPTVGMCSSTDPTTAFWWEVAITLGIVCVVVIASFVYFASNLKM